MTPDTLFSTTQGDILFVSLLVMFMVAGAFAGYKLWRERR